jgi:hypothetical protein
MSPMSRENRRRAAERGELRTAPRPPERRPATSRATTPQAEVTGERHISWRHCLIGWVVGEGVLLLLTNGALDAANAAFGGTDRVDGGIVGICSFLSVMLGGFVAARLAGRYGAYQGIVVAIGFIVVYAAYQFAVEASVVHSALTSGSHSLVDLGPMRVEDVFTGDLLALGGGTFGGWLSRR